MNYRILLTIGILFLLIGLLYPLGIVESVVLKYSIYAGVVLLGIGILALPGKDNS
ncbi:hypothetical protein [Kurthia sibirica]|uniref:hypothetical protein n=1 Tax=Kurthia sibirica TaxID=202750 RepID=UPI00116A2843|nr:hypothetical protein [Kurthia sibirica]GEK34230.1 hypothetical protein KSI01_17630 [Kurthia sibirica]